MPEKFMRSADWQTGLIEVAPNIFAFIQASGGAGISNAGLVVGSDRAMVLDTLATTSMATRFLAQIRGHTDRPINEVLLTHHHVDHILGMQFFQPARFIAHWKCRELVIETGLDIPLRWAKMRPHFADDLDGLHVCVPDTTFERKMVFHLDGRELHFEYVGQPAHSWSDSMLYLPDVGVLFAGDIMFYGVVPAAHQGHVGGWLSVMERVLGMDVSIIVPGHGPIGGKAEFAEMRDCLALIYTSAKRSFERGLPVKEAIAEVDLGPFAKWNDAHERMSQNVERAYLEFRGELAEK